MRAAVATLAGLLTALAALPAHAQALRPLCAARPGIGTPPCILDKRHVQVEVGIFSTQTDVEDGVGVDTIAWGSTEVSYGIDGINQLSVIWAPVNVIRVTDDTTGEQRRYTGVGDVALRWRHSLRNPDGEGLSIALEALVNVPTGAPRISENELGFGLLIPVSLAITDSFALIAAPGFIWSENTGGDGQHFDYNGSFGLTKTLGAFNLAIEAGYTRDGQPGESRSAATVAGSVAWLPPGNPNAQIDLGASVAANGDAPDLQVYLGFVHRF